MKIVLLSGVPTSGKTTASSRLMKNEELNLTHVSRDEVRKSIGETKYTKNAHARVREAFHKEIRKQLDEEKNVLADATHLTKQSRSYILDITKEYEADVYAVAFDISYKTIKKRNAARPEETRVPEDVLESMYKDYQIASTTEGFDDVLIIKE